MTAGNPKYNYSYKRSHSKRLILALFLFQFWNTASGMQDGNTYQTVMANIQEVLRETELPILLNDNYETWLPVKNKLSGKSVRSSFAVWAYQYLTNSSLDYKYVSMNSPHYLFQVKIPLLIEAVMTHAYLKNQVYDKKKGVISQASQDANLLKADNLQEEIITYVLSFADHTTSTNVGKALLITAQMIDEIDYGQKLELNYNFHLLSRVDNQISYEGYPKDQILRRDDVLKSDIKRIYAEYPGYEQVIGQYFKRNYYIGSSLFKYTVCLIAELLDQSPRIERVKYLMGFADMYGSIMQLVNDNADFIYEYPTLNKSSNDVLSDLKKGLFTFPLIVHYSKFSQDRIGHSIRNPGSVHLNGSHNDILKMMLRSGAILKSMKLGRELAKTAKSYIEPGRKSSFFLKEMLEIARHNRYYFHVKKANCYYQRNGYIGDNYRCEDNWSTRVNPQTRMKY